MNIETTPMSPDSDGAKLAEKFAKEKEYPEDYKGPKAGKSNHEEWIAVRDYTAFKYVRDGIWSYADFDCYLYAMCEEHYKKGEDAAVQALKAFQERYNIKAEVKPWYNKG
jgi:hypothetical protein